jgi:transposase-like protein
MGHTRKRHYNQYSLAFKLHAVLLASQSGILAKDVASSLGIHPIMLYRWCMEYRKESLFTHPLMKNHQMEKSFKEKKPASPEQSIIIIKIPRIISEELFQIVQEGLKNRRITNFTYKGESPPCYLQDF